MKWLSNASADVLGNSLIQSYMGKRANKSVAVDIEGFASEYLKLPVVYRIFVEDDKTKLGYISDGIAPLGVYTEKGKEQIVFPKGTIVIEEYLCREQEYGRRRFTVAHEVAHYVIDKSLAAADFYREFDCEKEYTTADLKEIFSVQETNVDRLAGALLMPEFMVKKYLRHRKRAHGIALYDNGFLRPEDNLFIQRMAADMGVSVTALKIRIRELGLYVRKSIDEYISELGLGKEIVR